MVFYRTAPPEWDVPEPSEPEWEDVESPGFDEGSGPVIRDLMPMSDEDTLILHSWEMYLQLQECSHESNVPSLEVKMYGYVRNAWSLNRAWSDFQDIVCEHSAAISHEAGEYALGIEGFEVGNLTYGVFRRIFIDMALQLELGVSETVSMTRSSVRESLESGHSDMDPLIPCPEESVITLASPLSGEETERSASYWFEEDMRDIFELQCLVPLGSDSFERQLLSGLAEYIDRVNFESRFSENPMEIIFYRESRIDYRQLPWEIHYRLFGILDRETGSVLKRMYLRTSERNGFIRSMEARLTDSNITRITLEFVVWTPHFAKSKPFLDTGGGISISVSKPAK